MHRGQSDEAVVVNQNTEGVALRECESCTKNHRHIVNIPLSPEVLSHPSELYCARLTAKPLEILCFPLRPQRALR